MMGLVDQCLKSEEDQNFFASIAQANYYTGMHNMQDDVFKALKDKDKEFMLTGYGFRSQMVAYAETLHLATLVKDSRAEVIKGSLSLGPESSNGQLEIPMDHVYLNSTTNL